MLKRINGYTFVCESRNTRSGFAHDCALYYDECEISKASCYYYNRTWECYQYQSVMKCAVNKRMDEIENRSLKRFKELRNYNKMTEKRKEEFKEYLNINQEYLDLVKLYHEL